MRHNQQTGAVLIISLVFLTLLTIAGVSMMQVVRSDMKIADNFLDKQVAMASADSAMADAYAKMVQLAANFNENMIGSDFNASCNNGLCFDGNYSGGSCQLKQEDWQVDDGIFQNEQIWQQKALTASAELGASAKAKYLIEFRCFDATGSSPKFRAITQGVGRSEQSRLMLVAEYSFVTASSAIGSVPAVLGVNNDLAGLWGSNIHAYYCHNGCQRDVDGNFDYVFDPDAIPGVGYGSCSQDGCDDSLVTGLVDVQNASQETYVPQTITTKTGEEFFAQYFNATKEQVEQGDSTLVIDLAANPSAFAALTSEDLDGYAAIYVKGNLDGAAHAQVLQSVMHKDISLIVDGDFTNIHAMINAGFVYVSGDMKVHGSATFNSFVAVEQSAEIFGSLSLYPQGNPLDNTNFGGSNTAGAELVAHSWFQADFQF